MVQIAPIYSADSHEKKKVEKKKQRKERKQNILNTLTKKTTEGAVILYS